MRWRTVHGLVDERRWTRRAALQHFSPDTLHARQIIILRQRMVHGLFLMRELIRLPAVRAAIEVCFVSSFGSARMQA